MMKLNSKQAGQKTWNNFKQTLPIILGVLILLSLAQTFIPSEKISQLFTGTIFDPIIGAGFGSIMAGNPITSYLVGDSLLQNGVSQTAVIAFIVAWVTVGIVQLPAESLMLGKKFAIYRAILAFISAIFIAIICDCIFKLFIS